MCNGKSEKAEEMEGQAVVDLGNEVRNRFFQLSKKIPIVLPSRPRRHFFTRALW